jgi:hypothetical protein
MKAGVAYDKSKSESIGVIIAWCQSAYGTSLVVPAQGHHDKSVQSRTSMKGARMDKGTVVICGLPSPNAGGGRTISMKPIHTVSIGT